MYGQGGPVNRKESALLVTGLASCTDDAVVVLLTSALAVVVVLDWGGGGGQERGEREGGRIEENTGSVVSGLQVTVSFGKTKERRKEEEEEERQTERELYC